MSTKNIPTGQRRDIARLRFAKPVSILAIGLLMAGTAAGQTTNSNAESNSSSSSGVNASTSSSSGITFNNPSNTDQKIEYSGGYANVPGVVAPGMSSGHPCAYAPVSAGLGIVGAGLSAGGQRVDDACLLAQMGESGAAVAMIAARNPDACIALRNVGKISPQSICRQGEGRAQKASSPRPVARAVAYSGCRLEEGKIYVKVARGAERADAISECRSYLGR